MDEVVSLTKKLIRFRSTHDRPDEIRRCADFITGYLDRRRIDYRRFDHRDVPSILVLPPGRGVPVLLMSHMDVVSGTDESFIPFVSGGRLYGRGSIDDKYAVALSLVLLTAHVDRLRRRHLDQADLPFGVLITADEEIGGKNGARRVLASVTTDFCIALDGGSVDRIIVREKGILKLKLTAKGRAAHASRPWLGDNAIDMLIDDYMRIKPLFDLQRSDHWHRTLNFSILQAGRSHNQVPELAEAYFDVRYTEEDVVDDLVARMRGRIRGDLVVEAVEPVFHGGESRYLDLLRRVAPAAEVGCEHGASDARYLKDYGIDGVVWGADGDLSQHSAREHVAIDSIGRLYRLLDEFLLRVAAEAPAR